MRGCGETVSPANDVELDGKARGEALSKRGVAEDAGSTAGSKIEAGAEGSQEQERTEGRRVCGAEAWAAKGKVARERAGAGTWAKSGY